MKDYSIDYEYCSLSDVTQINYSFKIFSLTEVCVVCVGGSHGTHVAGCAAAYHPECPDKNGPAPGAQIVSIKISDSRMGTSTTSKAGIRALRACIQNGVSLGPFSSLFSKRVLIGRKENQSKQTCLIALPHQTIKIKWAHFMKNFGIVF